ncbi:MAG: HlyD family efflux transporter periplasmic adaptor subunit [Crocinitomicaceae bacterium]|nr:HlyD family efflux transporter periplasmic adaptor subunit [Crocinitomicaceae bacterium]MBK8926014.1 HlyD family efflux transporter periplasmic adaptor subunit [Crocinitomicaceae bacterium]
MKIRHIVIIVLFLVINLLIGMVLMNAGGKKTVEEKDQLVIPHLEAMQVNNTVEEIRVSGYGTLSSYNTVDLAAEIQGKLYAGNKALKPGMRFKKGDLLFRIDDSEARYSIRARKSTFINLLANILPDIKVDYNSEYKKWSDYLESIKLNESLPTLPAWSSEKEKVFLSTRNVLTEYFNIKSQEEQLKKYTVHAPFSGMISEVYMPEFSFVNPGAKIIKVVQTGNYEIPVAVPVSQLDMVKVGTKCTIYSTDGTERGGGSVVRISEVINRTTQSVTVYVKPGNDKDADYIEGEYLLVKIDAELTQNGCLIPRSAVQDGQVYVYSKTDSLLNKKPVQILNENEQGFFVSGISDTDTIIIQEVLNYRDTAKYGIIIK